jgi:hypothetical protein
MARWRDGQFRVDEEWCGDAAVFVNWLYRTFCIFNVSMVPDGHHHKALKGKAPGHGPTGTKSAIRAIRNTRYGGPYQLPRHTHQSRTSNHSRFNPKSRSPTSSFSYKPSTPLHVVRPHRPPYTRSIYKNHRHQKYVCYALRDRFHHQ